MSQSYRLRYADEIAGGFVLLCITLLVAGIYVAGHTQGWFQKKLVLKARFDAGKGTYGLQEGAEVRILGTLAGRVGEIVPSESIGMETTLIIQGKFKKFVRTGSVAMVKRKFQVAGDAFVDITPGDSKQQMLHTGDYIQCMQDVELIEVARKMLDDFRTAAVPMLNEFRTILTHVRSITEQIEKQQGVAGKLIGDPEWATEARDIVNGVRHTTSQLPLMAAKLDSVMTNVQAITASLRITADRLPAVADDTAGMVQDARYVTGSLTGQVANIQAVLLQAESMLRETQLLVEGIQKHWLIRQYIPEPDATQMELPLPVPGERTTP